MVHYYEYEYPTYLMYIKLIDELSRSYNKDYINLYKKYKKVLYCYNEKKYNKLMRRKKELDLKIVKKVVFKFSKILKRKRIVIFFHGSYSKSTIRWNSDIDINFLYLDNDYTKEDFIVEELIVSALYKIFKLSGRDKIHTMMLYLPDITELKLDLNLNYYIKFKDDNIFKYNCRPNFERVYPKIYNSSRNVNDFYNYVKNIMFEEWGYSYLGLYNRDKNIINKFLLEKDLYLKKNKREFYEYIKNYKNNLKNISLNNIYFVSDFNKIVKINNLNKIYSMLLILKEFIVVNNGKCLNIDINKIRKNKLLRKYIPKQLLKSFFIYVYRYIFFVDRLENLFKVENINFSSRENTKIKIKNIQEKYNKYYNSDFKKDYEYYKKIIDLSRKILRRMERYE